MKARKLIPVPVLERPDLERMVDTYAGTRPVLLRDAAASDLLIHWQPAGLRARAADVEVPVNFRSEGFNFERWRVQMSQDPAHAHAMMHQQKLALGEVLQELFEPARARPGRDLALVGVDCDILATGLSARQLCRLAWDQGCTRALLWMAGLPRRHQMHFDPGDVFVLMVCGLKRFALAAPSQAQGLYPYPHNVALSKIPNVLDADLRRWPKLKSVEFQSTDVSPGEILYIPAGWWHQSEYLKPSASISFWPG